MGAGEASTLLLLMLLLLLPPPELHRPVLPSYYCHPCNHCNNRNGVCKECRLCSGHLDTSHGTCATPRCKALWCTTESWLVQEHKRASSGVSGPCIGAPSAPA